MKRRRITLLDVGLDQRFDASMTFVQGTLQSINAGFETPVCDIDFVRSHDVYTAASAFTATSDVLHVMAHGDHSETPAFLNSNGDVVFSLEDISHYATEWSGGISAAAVIADGCKTGTGVWQRAIRDCLQGPITYIGTSAMIGWHESTVYCSAFYGSLLRNMGKGSTRQQQAVDAAGRAAEAYKVVTGKQCPYRAIQLMPSRKAKTALKDKG